MRLASRLMNSPTERCTNPRQDNVERDLEERARPFRAAATSTGSATSGRRLETRLPRGSRELPGARRRARRDSVDIRAPFPCRVQGRDDPGAVHDARARLRAARSSSATQIADEFRPHAVRAPGLYEEVFGVQLGRGCAGLPDADMDLVAATLYGELDCLGPAARDVGRSGPLPAGRGARTTWSPREWSPGRRRRWPQTSTEVRLLPGLAAGQRLVAAGRGAPHRHRGLVLPRSA